MVSGQILPGNRLAQALDLLYPVSCLGCGVTLAGSLELCASCRNGLQPIGARSCPMCARPDSRPDKPCGKCQRRPPRFLGIHVRWRYAEPLAGWVRAFKYANRPGLERTLADLADTGLGTHLAQSRVDRVMAIPLHGQRLAERGYNQADRLAHRLARRYRLPLSRRGLVRTRATPAQAGLPEHRRSKNLRGAFRARPGRVAGRRILLVDDVVTTGATVDAATEALLEAGAEMVTIVALARA